MKIISENDGTYLVQLTTKEFYNVLGVNNVNEVEVKGQTLNLAIRHGTDIKISDVYNKYKQLVAIQDSKKISDSISRLRLIADALEPLRKIENQIKEIVKPKEEEEDG